MKQNLKQTARERFAAMTLFLLICLPFSLVQAQTVKVNGRVTDDLNEPMIGVSIVEKGTAKGLPLCILISAMSLLNGKP